MTYKTTTMNNNDFKVICVFNFLKRAQVEVSMTKLNKLYIYRQKAEISSSNQ